MNAKDALTMELIGKDIEIKDAKNSSLVGIKGQVIDETKYTLMIMHDGKKKTIMKQDVKIMVKVKDKRVLLEGKLLVKRPEDRITARGA